MKARQLVKIGYYILPKFGSNTNSINYAALVSEKKIVWVRILIALVDFLVNFSKQFDAASLIITTQKNGILPNGTFVGIYKLLNQSKVDIVLPPSLVNEKSIEIFDFCYPFRLTSSTFLTPKLKYNPQIFGILQTFSVTLWIAIFVAIITMILAYYVILKKKYSFHRILLHVFAVFLRQSSIIRHSSTIEKLLLFSWVFGAMFLCLAFDSIFLSFLAVPTVIRLKDVSQLATAVANGHYHCIGTPGKTYHELMLQSNLESLRILGKDIQKNFKNTQFIRAFYEGKISNFAIVTEANFLDAYARSSFVSEDRFLEFMSGMPVRKGFCCKKILNTFVHRLMASGLFSKYYSDHAFLIRLPSLLKSREEDNIKRILTLRDVAPAFIFLLAGHFVSFFVFVGEILSSFWKKRNRSKITKIIEKKKVHIEESV